MGNSIREMALTERDRMHPTSAGESEALAWRLSHTVKSLEDTIVVLRDGANTLAIDNAILRIENERLRKAVRLASSERGSPGL